MGFCCGGCYLNLFDIGTSLFSQKSKTIELVVAYTRWWSKWKMRKQQLHWDSHQTMSTFACIPGHADMVNPFYWVIQNNMVAQAYFGYAIILVFMMLSYNNNIMNGSLIIHSFIPHLNIGSLSNSGSLALLMTRRSSCLNPEDIML